MHGRSQSDENSSCDSSIDVRREGTDEAAYSGDEVAQDEEVSPSKDVAETPDEGSGDGNCCIVGRNNPNIAV